MINIPRVCALVVAAGESRRMNGVDKMMAALYGKPVLAWSVDIFQKSPRINRIIIVTSLPNLAAVRLLVAQNQWDKVAEVCQGGRRRQDSVAAGLQRAGKCEWILIHDGARPLISADLIEKGLAAAQETGSAIAAVPVIDTIKMADENNIIVQTPPRSRLWAAQTPQIFRLDLIEAAYRLAQEDVTDDASLIEMTGKRVRLFIGSYDNIKITTPLDLVLAESILKAHEE